MTVNTKEHTYLFRAFSTTIKHKATNKATNHLFRAFSTVEKARNRLVAALCFMVVESVGLFLCVYGQGNGVQKKVVEAVFSQAIPNLFTSGIVTSIRCASDYCIYYCCIGLFLTRQYEPLIIHQLTYRFAQVGRNRSRCATVDYARVL